MIKRGILYRMLAKLGIIRLMVYHSRCRASKLFSGPNNLDGFCLDQSLREPYEFYMQCVAFFDANLETRVKQHRFYFSESLRGFGEDAFHVMWAILLERFRPETFLEIGVYRGQTLSLVSLLQQQMGIQGSVTGISPFLPAGDSVSHYLKDVDYLKDTQENFRHFNLNPPRLIKAFSADPEALDVIRSTAWDCIYIDGNHDYEVALRDWRHCSEALKPGGLIVLDDAGLTTAYRAPFFATRGHPGPSRVAQEVDRTRFDEILQVGHNRVFRKRS